ncbi:angiogenin-2-like [Anolis carolinensis]|uniref:angiogenin-2-like n=1 Tax=Anolis carolinensis TaxID=28377 RepID=UPI00046287EF|nr:PREDICTED: angiogenin-2-like [Anolis carolinensis]|eukprot:XP_008113680.1 PREDICTED: angiogenin-2-like [Anolis carolinensis]
MVFACVIASCVSSQNPRHEKFWRQHHDFPRSNVAGQDYCGAMMLRRGMARPCKDTNSFVHVPRNQLKDVCGWAGTHYRRALRISREPLSVTTCKLQETSPRGQCRYWSHTGQRQIHIGCDASGWPIRFEESNFM